MRRGVTLLEILVAAILLSVGLLGAVEVVSHSAVTQARMQDRARALMVARSKLEEILKEPVLQVGSDRGEGVDQTTDYDWQANIEESANASLVLVTVVARNRITGVEVSLSTLRRPDVETAPDTSGGTSTGTGTTSTTPAGSTL